IYILFIVCNSLCALTDSIWAHIDARSNKRHLPLKGVVQLIKLIIWVIGVIIVFAILLGKSPGSLLAGLGAFAAVLMLVFKDSILGVVAGVQLADNDSLHVGDWIAVPGTDANGTVMEVGLTAVKIENWDKTVSTVPPYSLVTTGFKNYRNMSQSNTRRICRSYLIDADSVVETNEEMLARFAQIPLMKDWIEKKIEQRKAGKVENVNNSAGLVDGSIDTNLGVFRAYIKLWLDANPNISRDDTCFVSTLGQTSAGIPLQIYCFTSTSSWLPYEGIQSTVFEHLAVMLYRFNLYTFEYPTGRDEIIDGYLSPGKNPQEVFGMPYPMFYGAGTPVKPAVPPKGLYSDAPSAGSQPGTPSTPGSDPSTSPQG
ncbi:MAG: mechanosensitive ion channel family protein, partial [Muribaculaceae bacterium]|nr:mechanosensitive ion channel family protein [Muribaculaceae bacterium]